MNSPPQRFLTEREVMQLRKSLESRSIREFALTVCSINQLMTEVKSIHEDLFTDQQLTPGNLRVPGLPSVPIVQAVAPSTANVATTQRSGMGSAKLGRLSSYARRPAGVLKRRGRQPGSNAAVRKTFYCVQCNLPFDSRVSFISHVNNAHHKFAGNPNAHQKAFTVTSHPPDTPKTSQAVDHPVTPNSTTQAQSTEPVSQASLAQIGGIAISFGDEVPSTAKSDVNTSISAVSNDLTESPIKQEFTNDPMPVQESTGASNEGGDYFLHVEDGPPDRESFSSVVQSSVDEMLLMAAPQLSQNSMAGTSSGTMNSSLSRSRARGKLPTQLDADLRSAIDQHVNNLQTADMFDCDQPDCRFSTQSRDKFRAHLMKHKGLNPHVCHICNYSCKRSDMLKRHFAVHTSVKPYQCTECKFGSVHNIDLVKHMRSCHPGKEPYSCPKCSHTAITPTMLRKHVCTGSDNMSANSQSDALE